MQFIQIKHKAKLKSRQLDFKGYLIPILIFLLVLPILLFIKSYYVKLGNEYVVDFLNNDLLLLVYYSSLAILVYLWYFSPFSFSRVQRMKYSIRKIIETNNFFYEQPELKKITLSMEIDFYWENELLILDVYPNGGLFSHKMNELTTILQTSLKMKVLALKDDYADHTTYILVKETSVAIDASDYFN